ncbi:MAG: APC family permease [Thermoplasmatota archaeon]
MELKKELGLLEVFCISSGAMISSGLFILPALVFSLTGPAMILSYAIASLLVLPAVLTKAELSTAMPRTGGIYFFIDRSMGPMIGTIGGLAAWFSLAFKSAFSLLGIGIFMILLEPALTTFQIKLFAVGFCLVFMVVNLIGVKLAAKVQSTLVAVLIFLLVAYIGIGAFFVKSSNFDNFFSEGHSQVLATSGMVFVSFAGVTKIAAMAGEVKKPERNLPYGMLLSWAVVSLLYVAVITVTVGILSPDVLSDSLTPISTGGREILGYAGLVLMSIAGLLAFITTGNAGIMAASRNPLAMGRDDLVPESFSKLNRQGTPWVAILITTAFMISVILFLDLESFVKTASTLKLVLFTLACVSLIFMRQSNIKHYRPKFRSPFYPYIQIFGVFCYTFLIIQMGFLPILVAVSFVVISIVWYVVFARRKVKREYAFLYVAENVLGEKERDHLLDEELRTILIERDRISLERFRDMIRAADVLDLNYFPSPEKLTKKIAHSMSPRIRMSADALHSELIKVDQESHMITMPGYIIMSYQVPGKEIVDLSVIRTKRGALFTDDPPATHAGFVLLFSKDEKDLFLHTLMWINEVCGKLDLDKEWKSRKGPDEIRDLLLKATDEMKIRNG